MTMTLAEFVKKLKELLRQAENSGHEVNSLQELLEGVTQYGWNDKETENKPTSLCDLVAKSGG